MTFELAPVAAPTMEPDVKQALTFFATLFPTGRGESIHFRGVSEPKDNRSNQNLHYALDENFSTNLGGFLEWCAVDGRAAFFLPGVVQGHGTGKADVISLPAILIDFDKGNPDESLSKAEALIGPATLVVESGGRTEHGPKLHAYWRLDKPATGEEIAQACALRETLARQFGGDPAFKQPAQVIRLPGSLHFKNGVKRVSLRTVRPERTVNLGSVAGRVRGLSVSPDAGSTSATNAPQLGLSVGTSDDPSGSRTDDGATRMGSVGAASSAWSFDFNGDAEPIGNSVDRALTAPVHEGGVDELTRFEAAGKAIGHFIRMVREGRMEPDEAWLATKEWNVATLVPPWSEQRLRNDFDRLVRADVAERGPLVAVQPVAQTTHAQGWSLVDWRADRFQGRAPERRWLVEGLIPSGTAGLFAAVGDAGKSMLALKLALQITTAPTVPAGPVDVASPVFFGQPVTARGAAVVLTAEDDADEVHRRLNGLDPTFARAGRPLYIIPMLATGGARSILVDGPAGPVQTEFWQELRAQLLAIPDLKLVVLDPLSSFVSADINKDNVAGAALMTMLGELATTSGASVMMVHHFAKAVVPTGLSDARTAIRGAGALVDNGRWAVAMWEADQDKAYAVLKSMGQPERANQSGVVYFGGLAKGNAPGAKTLRTLVRSMSAGVLEDVTDNLAALVPRSDEVDDLVHRALVQHKMDKPRWSFPLSKNSVERYIKPVLVQQKIDVSVRQMTAAVERLLARGLIRETDGGGATPRYEPVLDA